jgi:hypothetical protein
LMTLLITGVAGSLSVKGPTMFDKHPDGLVTVMSV